MVPKRPVVLALAVLFGLSSAVPLSFAAKPKKKKAKKKADVYETSKYKSYKVLTDDNNSYRFDSKGNPIPPSHKRSKPGEQKKFAPPKLDSGGQSAAPAPMPEMPPAGQ